MLCRPNFTNSYTHRNSLVSAQSASNSKSVDVIPPAASLADAKNNIFMVIVTDDDIVFNTWIGLFKIVTVDCIVYHLSLSLYVHLSPEREGVVDDLQTPTPPTSISISISFHSLVFR
jgi:hypothetical protein